MTHKRNNVHAFALLILLTVSPGLASPAVAQFVVPIPTFRGTSAATPPAQEGVIPAGVAAGSSGAGAIAPPAQPRVEKTFLGLRGVTGAEAAAYWSDSTNIGFLQIASISGWGDQGAVYTELANVISGAWRVGGGVLIAAADSSAGSTTEAGFQRFVSGGGNISFNVTRPLADHTRALNTWFLMFTPRAWMDVPALGDTREVKRMGADLGLQLTYARLANDSTPFFLAQLRAAPVAGTDDFYTGIGRSHNDPFVYGAASVSIVMSGVRLAVQRFFGPSDLERHEVLQLSVTVQKPNG